MLCGVAHTGMISASYLLLSTTMQGGLYLERRAFSLVREDAKRELFDHIPNV